MVEEMKIELEEDVGEGRRWRWKKGRIGVHGVGDRDGEGSED